MDYFKEIEKMQEEFLRNPKENIEKLIREHKEHTLNIFETFQDRPDLLKLYSTVHKEYANLIEKMWKDGRIDGGMLKDDTESVLILQRLHEAKLIMSRYFETKKIDEVDALGFARIHASMFELILKKIKKVIIVGKFDNGEHHMDVGKAREKLIEIKKMYGLEIPMLELVINQRLRNSTGHDDTYFLPPDKIVFLEKRGKRQEKIAEFTIDKIYELIIELQVYIGAMTSVEDSAIIGMLEPFRKMSDVEVRNEIERRKSDGTSKPL